MKKISMAIVFMILFWTLSAQGQARKIVLLEEATNASCPPCAANNPKLQAFFSTYFGGVVSVRYHAWWPGNDPMYDANQSNNEKRITYYGISGVPHYLMDGTDLGVPSDPVGMAMNLAKRISQPAPVKIVIDADITPDTVKATLTLIGLESVSQPHYLRAAIIERMVTYTRSPGTNGERIFPDVMRKLVPNSRGYRISSINPGDRFVYDIDDQIESNWKWDDVAIVAWLQSDDTKEILQANISLPTYVIESSEPSAAVLDVNQFDARNYWIYNDNRDPLHLRIVPQQVHLPAGWSYHLMYNGQPHDSFDVTVAPGDSLHFALSLQTGDNADWIKLDIFAKNLDDPYGYGFTLSYIGLIPQGDILFVDDDGQEEYETIYTDAFHEIGADFTTLQEPDLLSLSKQLAVSQFQSIFWNVSWGFPAFVPEDIALLKAYLDQGGNLFLAGQDIAWDIYSAFGYSHFSEARDFMMTYLDATYRGDTAGEVGVSGIVGDPISDGLEFQFSNEYTLSPDWLGSQSGRSVSVFRHYETNRVAAFRFDSGRYKVVYLAFGLEQISDGEAARLIIERTLDWFGERTAIETEPEEIPHQFQLSQNHPNPFNLDTDIRYEIADSRSPIFTTLKVYNILGQEVRSLVDGFRKPGYHTVTWDGKDNFGRQMASGIYVYRLTTGTFKASRSMVLLK